MKSTIPATSPEQDGRRRGAGMARIVIDCTRSVASLIPLATPDAWLERAISSAVAAGYDDHDSPGAVEYLEGYVDGATDAILRRLLDPLAGGWSDAPS